MASTSYKWPDGFFDQAEKDLSVEKHPTESHKRRESAIKLDRPHLL